MYGRRFRRKRGFKRTLVTLLCLAMLVSVCFPGIRASANDGAAEEAIQESMDEYTDVDDGSVIVEVEYEVTQPNLLPSENDAVTVTETCNAADSEFEADTSFPVEDASDFESSAENTPEEDTQANTSEESGEIDVSEEYEQTDVSEENTVTDDSGNVDETGSEQKTTTFTLKDEKASEEATTSENEDYSMENDQSESGDPSYLEQLNALNAEAIEVGANADTSVYESIYERAMMIYEEAGSPSEGEVYEAVGQLLDTLKRYGYDPYLIETVPSGSTGSSVGHLEVQIAAKATLKMEGEETNPTTTISLTTSDQFHVSATYDGQTYTGFTLSGTIKTDTDAYNNATIRIMGSFPVGTKEKPVVYTVSIQKNVTFTLSDGSSLTVPVTFTVTGNYWSDINLCPPTYKNNNPQYGRNSTWLNGGVVKGSGMDFPISGEAVGQAITKGKLAIKKVVDGGSEDSFQFTIQNNSTMEYLTFNGTAYAGTSSTLTDACKISVKAGQTVVLTNIPVGYYRITEIQQAGYIITDADGNATDNYTVDYTVENKQDDSIPVATFTNKKLGDEAGISIRKTASGLNTYPAPAIAIYQYVNGQKGDRVWQGTLTANGDTYYLTKTLPAGTYLIEETGQNVDGYDCSVSLTGNAAIDGMVFTVEGGKTYNLIVNNIYTEKPKTTSLTVSKTVAGELGDRQKAFIVTVSYAGENPPDLQGVKYTVYNSDKTVANDTITAAENTQTISIDLKHGQYAVFEDIMIGQVVNIIETDTEYTETVAVTGAENIASAGNTAVFTVPQDGAAVVFTNTKRLSSPDTGIVDDSAPFLVLFCVAAIGAGVLFLNKRRYIDMF